jgi:hypothetical protein
VGFNLYVQDALGKHKLNAQLIPSTGFTTHTPQDYHFAATAGPFSGNIQFYLEDMDLHGNLVQHGPFQVDIVYGQRINLTPTNWQCSQPGVHGKICGGH